MFDLEISPVGETDLDWLSEDSIELGAPPREWAMQLPNWLDPLLGRIPTWSLLGALVIGLAIAAGLSTPHSSAPTVAAPVPTVTPTVALTPQQQSLATMVNLAEAQGRLGNFTIVDSAHPGCPPAITQPDPAAAIATAVTRYQPSFHLRDSGVGTELSGVCSAQLRFSGELGDTLVVTVIAPPNNLTPFTVTSTNDRTDAINVVMDINSWRVEIGEVGQPGTILDELQLVAIGTDARMRWS